MKVHSPEPSSELQPEEILDEPYAQIVSTKEFVEAVEKENTEDAETE
ncbi:hypothetical protein [Spirosoma migulaei]